MVIYGVALLSACLLIGLYIGELLGLAIGVEANVGGVGIAMLLLIGLASAARIRVRIDPITSGGITFWSAMYIPIVVAMAAKQNVLAALSGGVVAVLAGGLAVLASFALIPVMSRFGRPTTADWDQEDR
jgi:malonate transporter MadL subunit